MHSGALAEDLDEFVAATVVQRSSPGREGGGLAGLYPTRRLQ